jgi:hypothetical protein
MASLALDDNVFDIGLLQWTEIRAEFYLLIVGYVLPMEHEYGESVHPGLYRSDLVRRQRASQIQARDSAREVGKYGGDCHGHGARPQDRRFTASAQGGRPGPTAGRSPPNTIRARVI